MSKIRMVLTLMAILSTQQVFADNAMMAPADSSMDSKSCASIANVCSSAGFSRTETSGKRFWQDCMKPILLGQAVAGVTIDPAVVQDCRVNKIAQMEKEITELQKAVKKAK